MSTNAINERTALQNRAKNAKKYVYKCKDKEGAAYNILTSYLEAFDPNIINI